MPKCSGCEYEYPKSLLNTLYTDKGIIPDLCGICALEITNQIHGLNRTKFDGPAAEKARQAAIVFRARKEKPNDRTASV